MKEGGGGGGFKKKKKKVTGRVGRWSSYTVTIVWELAWADSALVVLQECFSYRGGRINRFDCKYKTIKNKLYDHYSLNE